MPDYDEARSTGRTLDDEGVPDLEGPLPEKERTGDPQEGASPPADRPASEDFGTTAAEQERGESISRRVEREVPDPTAEDGRARAGGGTFDDPVELLDEASVEGFDEEDELIGEAEDPGAEGLGAEDAAVHVRDDAPGGVDGPDTYLPRT
ncbi:MAG TPA: hypothetical protein VH986_13955 [Acidimicrobiia bacterium]